MEMEQALGEMVLEMGVEEVMVEEMGKGEEEIEIREVLEGEKVEEGEIVIKGEIR